jgi:hypothetical protein
MDRSSDFSPNLENLTSIPLSFRREALNSPLTLQSLGTMGLGFALAFPHNLKSQARWWTIAKGIQGQLQMLKALEGLGTLPQIFEKVLGIFQTLEVRDRQENFNTSLAMFRKLSKFPDERLLMIHKKVQARLSYLPGLINLMGKTAQTYGMQLSPMADDGGLFTHLQLF